MAKGQQRSNKEVKKPKQKKEAAKPENLLGSQTKLAANSNAPRPKGGKG